MKIVFEGMEYWPNEVEALREIYPEADPLITFIENWTGDQACFIFQTSGSTGAPRAIQIHRRQILASVDQTAQFLSLKKTDAALLCLDPGFVASMMMAARCMVIGMDLYLQRPDALPLKNWRYKIDFVSLVPFQVNKMMADGSIDQLSDIKNILIGGAALTREAFETLAKLDTNIFQTYGMTETVSHIALMSIKGEFDEGLFKALPGIVLDQDDAGALNIVGAVTDHQMIQTNDIVEMSDQHSFRWLGRRDHVINSGGIKIHPEQLELEIAKVAPAGLFFYVGAVADATLGERCVLIVEGTALTQGQFKLIQAHIASVFTKYHSPKQVLTTPAFSHTSSGKINRTQSKSNAELLF